MLRPRYRGRQGRGEGAARGGMTSYSSQPGKDAQTKSLSLTYITLLLDQQWNGKRAAPKKSNRSSCVCFPTPQQGGEAKQEEGGTV